MRVAKILVFFILATVFCLTNAYGEMRFWVDENGVKHFSDYDLIVEPAKPAAAKDEKKPDIQYLENSLGIKFVLINPGQFTMGSPQDEPARSSIETQHKVTLTKSFYMQATEVTQAQWKKVMGNSNPSHFKNCSDCPVERVAWTDAQMFIEKLNLLDKTGKYRLPTEAEWEYACRAGTKSPFCFGKCLLNQSNFDGRYPMPGCPLGKYHEKTVPVKSYEPNAWGLYDMHGNVWEWCNDWFRQHSARNTTNPIGPYRGPGRVLRGGSWLNDARICRSAYRSKLDPRTRNNGTGFRLCMDIFSD